jgi:hypothetical protein
MCSNMQRRKWKYNETKHLGGLKYHINYTSYKFKRSRFPNKL